MTLLFFYIIIKSMLILIKYLGYSRDSLKTRGMVLTNYSLTLPGKIFSPHIFGKLYLPNIYIVQELWEEEFKITFFFKLF